MENKTIKLESIEETAKRTAKEMNDIAEQLDGLIVLAPIRDSNEINFECCGMLTPLETAMYTCACEDETFRKLLLDTAERIINTDESELN